MAKRSRTAYAILGFLTSGPRSGYDLKHEIEGSTGNFWQESYGQIYPILKKLTEEQLVKKSTASSGGRKRFEYTITAKGRRALAGWLEEPAEPSPVRDELLLKVFFSAHVGDGVMHRQLEDCRDRQLELLGRYRGIEEQLLRDHGGHPELDHWLLTVRFGELYCQARLAWAEEALVKLAPPTKKRRKKS
ncbi:MAG: PadR family transcriptional regulator [Myxococcota bacterium]